MNKPSLNSQPYNRSIDDYTNRANDRKAFTKLLKNEIEKGWGVIPLLGSGISSSSGIPMGEEFFNYLTHCIFLSLAPHVREKSQQQIPSRCNFGVSNWPSFPKEAEITKSKRIVGLMTAIAFSEIIDDSTLSVRIRGVEDSISVIKNFILEGDVSGILIHKMEKALADIPDFFFEVYYNEQSSIRIPKEHVYLEYPLEQNHPENDYLKKIDLLVSKALSFWSDWILQLNFLSKLKYSSNKGVHLGEVDSSIIDSFNRNLVHNKKPSFAHKIIAHLSEPLRISTILTSNFDSLIEESFRELSKELEVYDVSINGEIPPVSQTKRADCIVKLHGSKFETRANSTVNRKPYQSEIDKFKSYFQISSSKTLSSQKHLLVVGFSGRDKRIIEFILGAINDFHDSNFKVFWIYFSDSDYFRLKNNFPNLVVHANDYESLNEKSSGDLNNQSCIIACRSHYPELFLNEIYQDITCSLTPGGQTFPYFFSYPPNPFFPRVESESQYRTCSSELYDEIIQCSEYNRRNVPFKEFKSKSEFLDVTYDHSPEEGGLFCMIDGKRGVSSIISMVFERFIANNKKCLWIDLNNFSDPTSLMTYIFVSISQKNGRYFEENVSLKDTDIKDNAEAYIKTLLRAEPHDWYIFIQGRDRPGMGFEWEESEDIKVRNKEYYKQLKIEIDAITKRWFNVIYLPFTDNRSTQLKLEYDKIEKTALDCLTDNENHVKKSFKSEDENSLKTELSSCKSSEIWDSLKNWFKTKSPNKSVKNYKPRFVYIKESDNTVKYDLNKLLFLYSITLFRTPRHNASIFSRCVFNSMHILNNDGNDNVALAKDTASAWIKELYKIPAVLKDLPGGFIYMHATARIQIQRLLEEIEFSVSLDSSEEKTSITTVKSWLHQLIAGWYYEAYRSTRHGTPLIESIYHRCQCIANVQEPYLGLWHDREDGLKLFSETNFGKTDSYDSNRDKWIKSHKFSTIIHQLLKTAETLEIAAPAARLWIQPGISQRCFKTSENEESEGKEDKKKQKQGFDLFKECSIDAFCIRNKLSHLALHPDYNSIKNALDTVEIQFERISSVIDEQNNPAKNTYLGSYNNLVGFRSQRETSEENEYIFKKDYKFRQSEQAIEKIISEITRWLLSGKEDPNESKKRELLDCLHNIGSSKYNLYAIQDAIGNQILLSSSYEYSHNSFDDASLLKFIKMFNQLGMVYLQQGKKIYERKNAKKPLKGRPLLEANSKGYFLGVCAVSKIISRISKWIGPAYLPLLFQEYINAFSCYAVSLAYLGRHEEAFGKINEARGYIHNHATEKYEVNKAKLHLRTSEVYLLKYRASISKYTDLEKEHQKLVSHLDDAWRHLSWSHNLLRDNSKSSFWWSLLYYLRCKTVSELKLLEMKIGGAEPTNTKINRSMQTLDALFETYENKAIMLQPKDNELKQMINRLKKLT